MPCYSLKCDRGPSTALEKRCHGPSSALAAELARFSSTSPPRPQQKKTQRPVLTALFDCLRRAHASPAALAIVVTGSGSKAFSAGFDINQFAKSGGGGGIDNRINDAFCELLESGAKPTVAAVRGLALGGGLEVALACNARVATKGTKLGLPELQLGILPGFGGTQRLPRLVGKAKALELLLSADMIPAQEAYRIGLINKLVPEGEVVKAARDLAKRILGKGQVAVRLIMESVDDGLKTTLEKGLLIEAENFGKVMGSADATEGVSAFLQKRQAKFQDR